MYCCLDAPGVFDEVHYGKLFTILLARNVSPYVSFFFFFFLGNKHVFLERF